VIRGTLLRWFALGVEDLPWRKGARNVDEIAGQEHHPEATTSDGHSLEEDRFPVTLPVFAELFEQFSGHSIEELSSPLRTAALIRGRIELTILAVARIGLPSSEVAHLINKHPSSMTRWLNLGILRVREDLLFRERINRLDQQISAAARNNALMRRVAPQFRRKVTK
jgi:hypothetical protein